MTVTTGHTGGLRGSIPREGQGLGGEMSDRTVKWLIVLAVVAVVAILAIIISGVLSNACPCSV